MAEELASSPLSSPPESVINVAINSPVKAVTKMPPSSPHQDAANETVEVATAQPATTKTEDEAKPPTPHDSDDGAQSSTQKRKASISRKAVPSKKPRRVVATPKKTAQDKKWEAPFVYTDSRSRLADADLRVCAPFLFLPLHVWFLTLLTGDASTSRCLGCSDPRGEARSARIISR